MKFKSLFFIAAAALFISHLAPAEITALVNYQGKLKKNGQSVNGPVNVTFKVFTGETNSECIYTESQQVTVKEGLYSTLLGKNPSQGNIQDASKLDDAYLEVEINGSTLKPREKFTPPAFAASAPQVWNIFGYGGAYGNGTFHGESASIGNDPIGSLTILGCVTGWELIASESAGVLPTELWITFPSPSKPVTIISIKGYTGYSQGVSTDSEVKLVLEPMVLRTNVLVKLASPFSAVYDGSIDTATSLGWFTFSLQTNSALKHINPGDYLQIRVSTTNSNGSGFQVISPRLMFQVEVR